MQISALARRFLHVLLTLSSASGAVTRPRLERRLGVASSEVTKLIEELASLGLLDAARLRLTLSGLAVAVACRAQATSQRPPSARRARATPRAMLAAPTVLFSQREAPRAVA